MGRRSRKRKRAPSESRRGQPGPPRSAWRRRVAGVIVAVAVVTVVALVARGRPPSPVEVRREAGLSILLITIDTLRADALGSYGNPRDPTPWLDRLAANGVRFAHATAHNVVTLPSHANILSGHYPVDHGVRDNSGFRFPETMDTAATLLRTQGYRTGAFVSAFPLDSQFGLARGFEVYEDSFVNVDTNPAFLVQERPGVETVTLARRWMEARQDRPFFCWVHVFEPHFPYEPPREVAARFPNQPYLGEVAATDDALRPLIEPLVKAGPQGRTLVIVTADHGEALGEHGEKTHGLFAYEGTLHVPLVLFAPRLLAPRVVTDLVRHVDLLPTLLDAVDAPLPEALAGRSLLPVASGAVDPAPPSYFEALSANLNRGWAPLHGVMEGRTKFIELPIPELYDLEADPKESRNLAPTRAETVRAMSSRLARFRESGRPLRRAEESEETRARLEALGYVTGTPAPGKATYTEADDPKNLIALDAMLHEIAGRHARGDLEGALTLCRELLRERPDMSLGLGRLAYLLREKGDLSGAVDAMKKAFSLDTSDMDTLAVLAAYLNEDGRAGETLELLDSYVTGPRPDLDVLIAYGVALAQTGRREDALATFARAREIDPSHAMVLVNIATVHMMDGHSAEARSALEAALELSPGIARAYNSLGVLAAREGRASEAIEHWKKAVELDPGEYDTLFNLGTVLKDQGRVHEARVYLERFVREAPPALYRDDIARIRQWLGPESSGAR